MCGAGNGRSYHRAERVDHNRGNCSLGSTMGGAYQGVDKDAYQVLPAQLEFIAEILPHWK